MLTWLNFHKRKRELQRELDRLSAAHAKDLQALESPTYEDKEQLHFEYRMEEELVEDELMVLVSSYWISVAHRLLIPIPKYETEGDTWERARSTGRYYLTRPALAELRTAIRKEQKERHEVWLLWLAALTGLIGALTGLVAVAL